MRIYLSCLQSARRHPLPAYEFWEPYFKRGIEEAGHSLIECPGVDWAEGAAPGVDRHAWRERTWTRVYEDVRRQQRSGGVDLFLAYLYPQQVDETAVQQIRALGVPCVNFFCDNVRLFHEVPRPYHAFDAHWVPERGALAMYARAGLRTIHRAMPVWVDPALRTLDYEEHFPPTFIGSRDVQRESLLAKAITLGAGFELRGPGWLPGTAQSPTPSAAEGVRTRLARQLELVRSDGVASLVWKATYRLRPQVPDTVFEPVARPPVFGDEYVRVTRASRVTIGINRYPSYRRPFSRPDSYSRLRDVEAPMMGACYLTEWAPELEHMYDLDREIIAFRSAEDLVEKLRELERDPARRRDIRRQGQRRALSQHTVGRTIDAIGQSLGIAV